MLPTLLVCLFIVGVFGRLSFRVPRAAYAALSSECAAGDRARHDKLVSLVDKMLALTPKLRAAKSDTERATLHNAVSATDRQIDALVYELYGLTPEEIALVEGGGS